MYSSISNAQLAEEHAKLKRELIQVSEHNKCITRQGYRDTQVIIDGIVMLHEVSKGSQETVETLTLTLNESRSKVRSLESKLAQQKTMLTAQTKKTQKAEHENRNLKQFMTRLESRLEMLEERLQESADDELSEQETERVAPVNRELLEAQERFEQVEQERQHLIDTLARRITELTEDKEELARENKKQKEKLDKLDYLL